MIQHQLLQCLPHHCQHCFVPVKFYYHIMQDPLRTCWQPWKAFWDILWSRWHVPISCWHLLLAGRHSLQTGSNGSSFEYSATGTALSADVVDSSMICCIYCFSISTFMNNLYSSSPSCSSGKMIPDSWQGPHPDSVFWAPASVCSFGCPHFCLPMIADGLIHSSGS